MLATLGSTRCGSAAHLWLGMAWHGRPGARTVLTASVFTQLIYFDLFWNHNVAL